MVTTTADHAMINLTDFYFYGVIKWAAKQAYLSSAGRRWLFFLSFLLLYPAQLELTVRHLPYYSRPSAGNGSSDPFSGCQCPIVPPYIHTDYSLLL